MNTSLISRFFAAVGACLGLAQAAVAHDSIAAETVSVWIFSDRYHFRGTRILGILELTRSIASSNTTRIASTISISHAAHRQISGWVRART